MMSQESVATRVERLLESGHKIFKLLNYHGEDHDNIIQSLQDHYQGDFEIVPSDVHLNFGKKKFTMVGVKECKEGRFEMHDLEPSQSLYVSSIGLRDEATYPNSQHASFKHDPADGSTLVPCAWYAPSTSLNDRHATTICSLIYQDIMTTLTSPDRPLIPPGSGAEKFLLDVRYSRQDGIVIHTRQPHFSGTMVLLAKHVTMIDLGSRYGTFQCSSSSAVKSKMSKLIKDSSMIKAVVFNLPLEANQADVLQHIKTAHDNIMKIEDSIYETMELPDKPFGGGDEDNLKIDLRQGKYQAGRKAGEPYNMAFVEMQVGNILGMPKEYRWLCEGQGGESCFLQVSKTDPTYLATQEEERKRAENESKKAPNYTSPMKRKRFDLDEVDDNVASTGDEDVDLTVEEIDSNFQRAGISSGTPIATEKLEQIDANTTTIKKLQGELATFARTNTSAMSKDDVLVLISAQVVPFKEALTQIASAYDSLFEIEKLRMEMFMKEVKAAKQAMMDQDMDSEFTNMKIAEIDAMELPTELKDKMKAMITSTAVKVHLDACSGSQKILASMEEKVIEEVSKSNAAKEKTANSVKEIMESSTQ